MSVHSMTKKWAVPLIGGGLLAGLFILGLRTTGWVSWLAFGVATAAFVAMCAYGVYCEGHAWQEIEDESGQQDRQGPKAGSK